jgi:hypothetical protein
MINKFPFLSIVGIFSISAISINYTHQIYVKLLQKVFANSNKDIVNNTCNSICKCNKICIGMCCNYCGLCGCYIGCGGCDCDGCGGCDCSDCDGCGGGDCSGCDGRGGCGDCDGRGGRDGCGGCDGRGGDIWKCCNNNSLCYGYKKCCGLQKYSVITSYPYISVYKYYNYEFLEKCTKFGIYIAITANVYKYIKNK